MNDKKTLDIYSIIAGIFFLVSGTGKIFNTSGFAELIGQYGFQYFSILAPFVAIFEIFLGLFLIFLIRPKKTAAVSFITLAIFTISFAYGYSRNGITDCGCFGVIHKLQTPPLVSFIRNGILLLMLIFIWIYYPRSKFRFTTLSRYVILIFGGITIFIAGLTFNQAQFTRLMKMPKNNVKKAKYIKNTTLDKYIKTSKDSTYAIIAFSYSCPHCLNSIENLNKYKESGIVDQVIGISYGSDESKAEFYRYFNPNFEIKELEHRDFSKITRTVPTIFFVKNDSIKFIIQSVAPSPLTLKKQHYLEKYF